MINNQKMGMHMGMRGCRLINLSKLTGMWLKTKLIMWIGINVKIIMLMIVNQILLADIKMEKIKYQP